MTRELRETFSDEEFEDLKDGKGDRTWSECLLMEVAGYDEDEV